MPKRARNSSESASPESKRFEHLTPTKRDRPQNKPHWTTSNSKVQGAIEYIEKNHLPCTKQSVFDIFGVSKSRGCAILKEDEDGQHPRRFHNDSHKTETRGRPSKLTNQNLAQMDRILQDCGIDGRSLTWEQLEFEADVEDVSGRTIQRHMRTMGYRKCLACKKGWISKKTAKNRVNFATIRLNQYPKKEDWHNHQFSDEMHSGYGPEHTLHIIRKPDERYCPDCIQHAPEPEESDLKRQHCWTAVSYDFKSDLTFYKVPTNSNGKMSLKVYRDVILDPVVRPWLEKKQDFILEEDGDSGHGTGSKNIVRTWKQKHGLRSYFNCESSPDLSPIENCWQAPKQWLKKYPHWDDSV